MLRKLLKYCSFKLYILLFTVHWLLFTVFGCAPKISPPPVYKNADLSLEEIITIAQGDINTLKAIADINIEEDNTPYLSVSASVLLKKPSWIHIRLYRYGMLTDSFLIKDDVVHSVSGRWSTKLEEFGMELYQSVFWWEGLENALMHKQGTDYVIRTKNREIRLDKSTLLPKSQKITANSNKISILYDKPKKDAVSASQNKPGADFWYPSVIRIESGAYKLTVKIRKLFINPPLEENDFKAAGESEECY